MRACSTANAVFLGLALAGFAFAACSSGQTTAPASTTPDAVPPGSAEPAPVPARPAAPTNAAPVGAGAGAAHASPAAGGTAAGPPRSDITNEPDGGVALNNAQPASDAGASDRLDPLINLIKANRDGFRRCFDLWGKTHRGENGTVYVVFNLKPDGKLDKAEIDAAKGNLHAADVESCMLDYAKTLNYPKSPSGKETRFTYPFDFKAK